MGLQALGLILYMMAASQPAASQPAASQPLKPPGPRALPSMPEGGRTVVVPVADTIDLGLAPFLRRVLKPLGPKDLVVLDVNTLGGRVDAALVIRDALLHTPARTVCWVNPRAISAGALISFACDVIAVSP